MQLDFTANRPMKKTDPAIEEARRAGIDVDLLDTNLALSVEERWRQHDAALALINDYEKARGKVLSPDALVRWARSGKRCVLEVREGENIVQIG